MKKHINPQKRLEIFTSNKRWRCLEVLKDFPITLPEKDGGDGGMEVPVGECEGVWEKCLYLREDEKENKSRGPLLTGQKREKGKCETSSGEWCVGGSMWDT